MRICIALFMVLALALRACGADNAAVVTAQKKKAEERWIVIEGGPFAQLETRHLLIYAPEAFKPRLKDIGALLEKHVAVAQEALQGKEPAELPGKVTVYLLSTREQFASFVRRVEKRRLEAGESGSVKEADDWLHVAVSPAKDKKGWGVEAQAGQHLAMLLLMRQAGASAPLPDWLVSGFGRATHYRVAPQAPLVREERRQAARLSRKYGPADIWNGTPDAAEAGPLEGSLADFLAYGPGAALFPKLLAGFKLEENMTAKTTEQALKAAGLDSERVAAKWKSWVVSR
jgi:hypothetical protein